MRYFLFLFIILSGLSAAAQSKGERIAMSNARMLEEAVFVSKDSIALENLFGSTVQYEHSNGKVQTREEAIHGIVSNMSTYAQSFYPSAFQVISKGDSIVVTHDFLAVERKPDGTKSDLKLKITTTWMKESGKWKLFRRVAVKKED